MLCKKKVNFSAFFGWLVFAFSYIYVSVSWLCGLPMFLPPEISSQQEYRFTRFQVPLHGCIVVDFLVMPVFRTEGYDHRQQSFKTTVVAVCFFLHYLLYPHAQKEEQRELRFIAIVLFVRFLIDHQPPPDSKEEEEGHGVDKTGTPQSCCLAQRS